MKEIKVSIITVVYNGEKTIEQTINSVANQDYLNIEYIIIDGASTDGTHDIVKKYKNDVDIFISEPDDGLYYAMNKGVMHASGDIIGIINSDDYYADTAVSKIVDYYNKHEVDAVYGDVVVFDETGYRGVERCRNIDALWYKTLPHPSVFIKKDIYMKYGLFNTKYSIAADRELLLRFYSEGVKFGYVNDTIAYFRRGGISSKAAYADYQESKEISMKYIDKCSQKDIYLPKIENHLAMKKFKAIGVNQGDVLISALNDFLSGNENDDLVIFGAGFLGIWCVQFLAKYNIKIDFFVDNDPLKCGKEFEGVAIKPPSELKNYLGNVLITAYEFENNIRKQLESINSNLSVLSLMEWAKKAQIFPLRDMSI